ncbi:MAG TPA: hypothetical protein VG738_12425 [Chitinophagaceae bacterium]|nr:hypothetical protein [Chitinophagaceae bacterium]
MKKISTCLVTCMCLAKTYTQTPAAIKQDTTISPGCGCIESPIAGYRYISPSGKLLLRATFMPVVFIPGTFSHSFSWAGFSIGKTF